MTNLMVLDPRAAFVDVGSERMHVSVAGDTPQVFGAVTSQLHALRDWLVAQGVVSVAMEATGVYWLPLFSVLEEAGLKVVMVNGRQTKNLPGRKTDMADCQWGATLHSHGLLRGGFVPPANIRQLQDYVRLRNDHIMAAASNVQLMQKALERMNVKLHDVISQLTGVSGMAVVRAILAGERDPERLLALCDVQIRRAKADRVRESLRGTWAPEHLFALRQAVQIWDLYQVQIADCDREIQALLPDPSQTLPPDTPPGSPPSTPSGTPPSTAGGRRKRPARGNAPAIPQLRTILAHLCGGRDLAALPGHTEYTVLQIVSEVGTDLTKWGPAIRILRPIQKAMPSSCVRRA